MFNKILIAGLCLAVSWVQGAQIRMYQNGPSLEALAAVAGLDDKADKVLPYTPLTGANVTVSPTGSYVWKTTAGTNMLTASGFTEGVDASCSMIITVSEGDTITASGLSFVDELEAGINHCFIRQMPTGEPKLFVSYVGVYGDIFVDSLAPAGGDGTSWANAYTNIQDAIDGATTGNLIMVKPGTYQPIDSLGKSITIESTDGAEVTIIDGNNTTRCARLGSDGQPNATLNGFKLANGYNFDMGGGSYYGTLNNCILTGNATSDSGGGSYYGTLNNCTLTGNTSDAGGGSAYSTLNNCTLTENTAYTGGGGSLGGTLNNCILTGNATSDSGGGSLVGTLNNCTLSGNTARMGGGSFQGTLNNCIVWGNTSDIGGVENYYDITFSHSNTSPQPSGDGNISEDPLFVDAANNDFRLQPSSPCIDAGSNDYVTTATDLDGNPRIVGDKVDMGAYEYQGD